MIVNLAKLIKSFFGKAIGQRAGWGSESRPWGVAGQGRSQRRPSAGTQGRVQPRGPGSLLLSARSPDQHHCTESSHCSLPPWERVVCLVCGHFKRWDSISAFKSRLNQLCNPAESLNFFLLAPGLFSHL